MSKLTRIKLAVAVLGAVVWFVGFRMDDDRVRWAGIAILAGALLLRLLDTRTRL